MNDPDKAINLLVDYTKDACKWHLPKPPQDEAKAWDIFWKMFFKLKMEFGLDVPDHGLDAYYALILIRDKFTRRPFLHQLS